MGKSLKPCRPAAGLAKNLAKQSFCRILHAMSKERQQNPAPAAGAGAQTDPPAPRPPVRPFARSFSRPAAEKPVKKASSAAKTVAPAGSAAEMSEAGASPKDASAASEKALFGGAESPPPEKGGLFKSFKKKPAALKKPDIYKEKFKEMEKSFLYLKADFENYKRRAAKERSDLALFGGEHFIRALVNEVVDDLDRAYEDFKQTQSLEHFKSGMDLIRKNLQKILKNFHVEAEDPTGKPFDPDRHEALSRQPTDKAPRDHILTTFKKAYTLHNKLIRPAQAVVATATEPEKAAETTEPAKTADSSATAGSAPPQNPPQGKL